MPPRTALLVTLAVLAAPVAATAAPPAVLDLIPQDAVAVAVRDLKDLTRKGDKLAADTGVQGMPRPSQLFAEVVRGLGITKGLDETGPALVMLANPAKAGVKLGPNGEPQLGDLPQLLVAALSYTDRELRGKVLKDVPGGRGGLATSAAFAPFTRHSDPAHQFEFHVSLHALGILAAADDLRAGAKAIRGAELSSFALTAEAGRLQLDVWLPVPEVKVLARVFGF